jgi:DNA excision repair protein ERCC-2
MVFADKRFARADKRSKLPKWIVSEMDESCTNLSTDMALSMGKQFFKTMAQKVGANPLGVSLWNEKYVAALGNCDHNMEPAGH